MQLLLKQQPVGTDLRKISAALKMVTDMERIGDQATDIAEILNTGSVHVPVTAIPLQEMADYAMHMVNDSVTAYVEEKSDLAKKVISSDDILDNLFNKVRNALDQNTMGFSSDEVLDLLMISKYYERIGDHATNIGEWAEFSVDGIHRNGQEQHSQQDILRMVLQMQCTFHMSSSIMQKILSLQSVMLRLQEE